MGAAYYYEDASRDGIVYEIYRRVENSIATIVTKVERSEENNRSAHYTIETKDYDPAIDFKNLVVISKEEFDEQYDIANDSPRLLKIYK